MSSLECLCKNNVTNRCYLLSELKSWPCRKSNRAMTYLSPYQLPQHLFSFLLRLNANSYLGNVKWSILLGSSASLEQWQKYPEGPRTNMGEGPSAIAPVDLKCCVEPRNEARTHGLAVQLVNFQSRFQECRYVGFSIGTGLDWRSKDRTPKPHSWQSSDPPGLLDLAIPIHPIIIPHSSNSPESFWPWGESGSCSAH